MRLKSFTFCAILLAALTWGSFSAQAQEKAGYRLISPERVEFNPHWFMQLQGGLGYTVGESSSFKDLSSPAVALNFGYRFTPKFALRFGASGFQGKGVWVASYDKYKFNYLQGNVDAMLSLTNLLCGWNPDRVLDFYGFLGVGGAYGFNNDEAVKLADKGYDLAKLWRDNRFFIAGRGGLGVNINVSKTVAINVEANANMLPDNFNSKNGDNVDWQLNGLIGLTIKLGKGTRTIPAVYEEIPPEPAPAPAPAPAPKPAPKPAPVPEKVQPMTQNIFFVINSARISKAEQTKVDLLVDFLKNHPNSKVVVTGYADKETGTAPYNMNLSKRRSAAVAKAIEAGGIEASRIVEKADGCTVQPFPKSEYTKNRVVIAITEE